MKEKFEGSDQKNVMSFTIGNDATVTKASGSCGETQVASYALEGVEDNDLVLIETVSSADNLYYTDVVETKGTPVYTENFDALYGTQVYATAFAPKTGDATAYTAGEVWGSYLENGGTVNLKKTADHTYSYDYSKGQKVNLSWPESGKLLYFIQAPYETTNALNPKFYSDGSIQFDYTDPTTASDVDGRQTIVDGASAQKDILFTSKTVSKPADGVNQNNILMYHALTAVKFKTGNDDIYIGFNPNPVCETRITKVTFKSIKANGHCTITPNYTDANTSADSKPSNIGGDAGTKSSSCSDWTGGDLVVDYSQTFSGIIDYDSSDATFANSFYDGNTNVKNLGKTDGSEIMLMVPQTLNDVEIVVDFTIKYGSGEPRAFSRTVKLNGVWNAGELHTYTLTVNKVAVNVTDTMSDDLRVKDKVSTTNTGNVTAYLRAEVATAWYYGYGDDAIVVAAYLENGRFSNGLETTSYINNPNWIKGDDGFYYYKNPVLPGKSALSPIFVNYTAPGTSETFPGAHLEMKIILQGVQFDSQKSKFASAWGTVKVAGSSDTVVSRLSTTPEGTDF